MKTQILLCWADAPKSTQVKPRPKTRPTVWKKATRDISSVKSLTHGSSDYSSWHQKDYISYIIVNVKPLFPDHPVSAYFQFGPQICNTHSYMCDTVEFQTRWGVDGLLGCPPAKNRATLVHILWWKPEHCSNCRAGYFCVRWMLDCQQYVCW